MLKRSDMLTHEVKAFSPTWEQFWVDGLCDATKDSLGNQGLNLGLQDVYRLS